jgi:BRCT domain type II-containing protein
MIEVVSHEKFYKDVAHEPFYPTVPKDPRAPRASSSAPAAAPSRTTRNGGASSASSSNTGILKMFRRIHGSALGCVGAAPSDCAAQLADYPQSTG